jgi:hypothetical protein
VSVVDDKNNTWTLAGSVNNGSVTSAVYTSFNVAAGTKRVTVKFDQALYGCQFVLSEFYNVTGFDQASASSNTNAPSISPGTLAPTFSGDLIYNYGYDDANPFLQPGASLPVTRIAGGPGFSLLSADIMLGSFAQYAVQSSATPINPSVSIAGGSDTFNSVGLALKSGSQGTPPPPGIRIVHVYHVMVKNTTPIIFPTTGNLILFATARERSDIAYDSVRSSPSNSWTKVDESYVGGVAGVYPPQVWYAQNATPSLNLKLTVGGVPGPNGTTFVMYDVANVEGFDVAAGRPSSYLVTSNPTQSFSGFTPITPSTPNGLVFAFVGNSFGPAVAESPGTMDTVLYEGQIDADLMDNADVYSHYYNPNTSQVSFSYKMNSGGHPQSEEKGIAIAFKSSAGPTPTPTPTPVPTPTPTPGPTYKQWQLKLDRKLNALYHGPGLSGPVNQWILSNPIYPDPTPTPGPIYKQWQLKLDRKLNALYHGPGLSGPVNQWMLSNPIYPDPTP